MRKLELKFDKPTLMTLTAPTCSGKSFILDHLTKQHNPFDRDWEPQAARLVSTTTRPPRRGEENGFDYYFISEERSHEMEEKGEFAELVEFRGTRYGVSHNEMQAKMNGTLTPIVVLEPEGIKQYEAVCRRNGWEIFKVYVHTIESLRIERLGARTSMDIRDKVEKLVTGGVRPLILPALMLTDIEEQMDRHTDRLLSITGDERRWQGTNSWDAIVTGEDLPRAIADLEIAVKWRNYRNSQLNESGYDRTGNV